LGPGEPEVKLVTHLGPVGLTRKRPSPSADTDLWLPSSKAGVVDELCEAVSERASVLLTGDPGVVKTCVLRALRKRLTAGYRLTYCHNATLGRRDFYRPLPGSTQPHPPC
jgi:general secretion pathway protein A